MKALNKLLCVFVIIFPVLSQATENINPYLQVLVSAGSQGSCSYTTNLLAQNVLVWPSYSSINWTYHLNDIVKANPSDNDSLFYGEFADSFNRWQHINELDISFATQGASQDTVIIGDNENKLIFIDSQYFSAISSSGTSPSTTFITWESTGNCGLISNFDIMFQSDSNNYKWSLTTANINDHIYNLPRIATHEIGHIVGLGHPLIDYSETPTSIMKVIDNEIATTINQDDIYLGEFLTTGHLAVNDSLFVYYTDFYVDRDIWIDEGCTLVLDVCTTPMVHVSSTKCITINGTLRIKDDFTFTRDDGTDWAGLVINNGGIFELTSGDATIEYATTGATINGNSSTPINNGSNTLKIQNCTTGMNLYNCSPTINNVLFNNITGDAVVIDYLTSNPTMQYVSIHNANYGMDIHSGADAIVKYSTLYPVTQDNIYFENGAGINMNGYENDVYRAAGKYAINNARPSTVFINVNGNYWNDETNPNVLFSDPSVVTCTSIAPDSLHHGVYKPAMISVNGNSIKKALEFEDAGEYEKAFNEYIAVVKNDGDIHDKRMALKLLVRLSERIDNDYGTVKMVMNDELPSATGWYRAYLDCALCDIMVKEGKYGEAANELEKRARHYEGTSVEAIMLAEIANIYGTKLGSTVKAKEYADRAAAINPGESSLRIAYAAAGIDYDHTKYTDRFAVKAETFDIQREPENEPVEPSAAPTVSISPNPANPATTISFTLPAAGNVKLDVYAITGQKVATLVDDYLSAGNHTAVFDGANLASGIYFYRLETAGQAKTGKMMLVK